MLSKLFQYSGRSSSGDDMAVALLLSRRTMRTTRVTGRGGPWRPKCGLTWAFETCCKRPRSMHVSLRATLHWRS